MPEQNQNVVILPILKNSSPRDGPQTHMFCGRLLYILPNNCLFLAISRFCGVHGEVTGGGGKLGPTLLRVVYSKLSWKSFGLRPSTPPSLQELLLDGQWLSQELWSSCWRLWCLTIGDRLRTDKVNQDSSITTTAVLDGSDISECLSPQWHVDLLSLQLAPPDLQLSCLHLCWTPSCIMHDTCIHMSTQILKFAG